MMMCPHIRILSKNAGLCCNAVFYCHQSNLKIYASSDTTYNTHTVMQRCLCMKTKSAVDTEYFYYQCYTDFTSPLWLKSLLLHCAWDDRYITGYEAAKNSIASTLLCDYQPRHIRAHCGEKQMQCIDLQVRVRVSESE